MRLKILFLLSLYLWAGCEGDSNRVTYDPSYENCPLEYESLEQSPNEQKKKGDLYSYKGVLYSGCAKQAFTAKNMYSVYEFVDGYLRKEYVYYNNGKLSREFSFKEGLRHGTLRMYFEDGTPYVEEYYEKGEADGKHLKWHDNATLAREAKYKNGKLKSEKVYNREGQLIDEKK